MELGDELFRRVWLKEDESGTAANSLLTEFYKGYPLEKLRPLLRSDDEELVRVGIFIAAELCEKAKPLLDDVVRLLDHESQGVCFDAISSILEVATDQDGLAVAKVVRLLADPRSGVRWKVNQFLVYASIEQLQGGLVELELTGGPDAIFAAGLRALIAREHSSDDAPVFSLLRDASPILRKFGLAASLRSRNASAALRRAVEESDDSDVRTFGGELFTLRDKDPGL